MIYLMYEKLKGPDSFYHPFFDMVDAPTPTVYWPEDFLEKCDITIMKDSLAAGKIAADEQWEKLNNFMAIYPDFFEPRRLNKDLFIWALGFVNSRTFGWGLPATMLVPLADCLNHNTTSNINFDIFEKNLHATMNKIYMYKHNWEKMDASSEDLDKMYDKNNSKIKVACNKLFKEDELQHLPAEILAKWDTEDSNREEAGKKLYSRELCFQRFQFNRQKLSGAADEEMKFDQDDEEFGTQLWGIGYITSDDEEERDDEELIEDEDELFEEAEIMNKIRYKQEISASEMETISYSTRLRDVYNNRWWNAELPSFFVCYNQEKLPIRAGNQAFYSYGKRSDDFLVEQYGFCLDPGQNPFSSWKIRLNIGVSPSGEIEDIEELIPPQSAHDDKDIDIDKVTDLVSVQSYRTS